MVVAGFVGYLAADEGEETLRSRIAGAVVGQSVRVEDIIDDDVTRQVDVEAGRYIVLAVSPNSG